MVRHVTHLVRRLCSRIRILLGDEEERLEAMVGPPGVWRESRAFQMSFLESRGLQPHHTVLDIGCGPLRGGVPLIRRLDAGHYVGIDIRPESVHEARRLIEREQLQHKRPTVLVSDSFGADELSGRVFDFVWCFQVLYHFEDELADRCLARVASFLGPTSACYGNVNVEGPSGTWQDFPFVRRTLAFYEELAARHGMEMTCLGQLGDLGYTRRVAGRLNHMLEFRRGGSG